MDLGINGRPAIICESSRGLGKACATALAREGAHVVINGLDEARLSAAAHEIRALTGASVTPVRADINTPEGRMYLSRQLYEEALHVQFYLTLLDTYIPDHAEREEAFSAIENIPSIRQKGEFCFKWIDSINSLEQLETREDRQQFLLNLICFAACIEGLFFFAAFAYVYFLRSKGLLNGLAAGTNWVFRDESCHMNFAFEVIEQVRREEPDLFDDSLIARVKEMISEAVEVEYRFAEDLLSEGISGLSLPDTREYLQYVADQRLMTLGIPKQFGSKNPFGFMELQDVQELTNFFERTVSSYQSAVDGEVEFDQDF